MVELVLPFEPLRGSTRVTTIPLPRATRPPAPRPPAGGPPAGGASVTSGKLSTLLHVAAPSVLLHRPAWRVPRYRTLPLLGSTVMRSPLPRPSSLPPNLKGTLVRAKVLPRSLERRMAPSGVLALVYVPQARYTRLESEASTAMLSTPIRLESSYGTQSSSGSQRLVRPFQR